MAPRVDQKDLTVATTENDVELIENIAPEQVEVQSSGVGDDNEITGKEEFSAINGLKP